MQAQGNQALDNIIGVVEQGNRLADEINLELDKQIEQLDRMENTVKENFKVMQGLNFEQFKKTKVKSCLYKNGIACRQ